LNENSFVFTTAHKISSYAAWIACGLAVTGGIREVWAQPAGKIESMAPELDRIISTSEPIRELARGYGGDIGKR